MMINRQMTLTDPFLALTIFKLRFEEIKSDTFELGINSLLAIDCKFV